MKLFEEGADKGITRLLMAFYFRRAGVSESGEKTFEFTHKSFGEYLTAKRVVRLLGDIFDELQRHHENVDKGWDEREALVRWIRLCGPTPLDKYLFKFIENEVRLAGQAHAVAWQEMLCKLMGFELRNGMPMEAVNLSTYKEASRQARNAEESLIVVLNACAGVTKLPSDIDWPGSDRASFKTLLHRLLGHSGDLGNELTLNHLGYINLKGQHLASHEFFQANISDLDLHGADLSGASLKGANLSGADLSGANLQSADLNHANLSGAELVWADLSSVTLRSGNLRMADLYGADLSGADLTRADLGQADLDNANLNSVNLRNADLSGANLSGANLDGADLKGVDLMGADLDEELIHRSELELWRDQGEE
jgi:hypothetical protein